MWEEGGGMTSGGSGQIITGRLGEPRRPVYQPRGGHLACGEHALITVHEGFHVVRASVKRGSRDYCIISKIISTEVKDIEGERWEVTATLEELNKFSQGEWDQPLDPTFLPAVEAAFKKAGCYHCRCSHYIDRSEAPQKAPESPEAQKQREQEDHLREIHREQLRAEKAQREALEKAQADQASRDAKASGLGARLEAVNLRLLALGRLQLQLGETHFVKDSYLSKSYTEENISWEEERVSGYEKAEVAEKAKKLAKESFLPAFEALKPRVESLGLTLDLTHPELVQVGSNWYGSQPYSAEGLAKTMDSLDKLEAEARKEKERAFYLGLYQKEKLEGEALGLPADVRIWTRTGGSTNCGNGWVVTQYGQDRDPTSWDNPRPRYRTEGFKIWEQILPGEVVLEWSKACSSAEHHFRVIYRPQGELPECQLDRILEIQDEIEEHWEGARGLASGVSSPSVGAGWGLGTKKQVPGKSPETSVGRFTLDDLKKKWGPSR